MVLFALFGSPPTCGLVRGTFCAKSSVTELHLKLDGGELGLFFNLDIQKEDKIQEHSQTANLRF